MLVVLFLAGFVASKRCNGTNAVWTVYPDYRSLHCGTLAVKPRDMRPVNALLPSFPTPQHLSAYLQFEPWRGRSRVHEDLLVDFIGMTIPYALYCNEAYIFQTQAHAIRTRQCSLFDELKRLGGGRVQHVWPVVSEEYFEYSDVLEAVSQYAKTHSRRPFAFVELGSGYGHFTLTAHRALMQLAPKAAYRYLCVDVVDSLGPALRRLARLNDMDATALSFHAGFVSPNDTATTAQSARGRLQLENYEADWAVGKAKNAEAAEKTVSLRTLFNRYDFPHIIDMIDMDIQRAEYDLLTNVDVVDMLTRTTKRIHIGTHTRETATLTQPVKALFLSRGWRVVWDFDHGHRVKTPYGPVKFGDGVLAFVNPALAGR